MIIRDNLLADFPSKGDYDYFRSPWASLSSLASGNSIAQVWYFYYKLINNAHSTIRSVDPGDATPVALQYLGNALTYRAMAYFDLARMYEFKPSGVPAIDNQAISSNIMGLTVPLVEAETDEQQARNNPRAPFYKMYRFILNDLDQAEEYLADYTRPAKNVADLSVVYGLKARIWLELATRFTLYPEDLTTALSHENDEDLNRFSKFDITTAKDCYAKAIEYADKVIAKYTPLTKAQWHDKVAGFNTCTVPSWVFAIIIGSAEAVPSSTWRTWTSYQGPENTFGVANADYNTFRMIGKNLYDEIGKSDWRRSTWIDPVDAGDSLAFKKYSTLLDSITWMKLPAYTALKFRPRNGDMANGKIGAAVDIPVMRVEEMHFIKAEALTYTQGLATGKSEFESFMNTYRYTDGSYSASEAENVDDFINNYLITEKRIEFWGEGLSFFDIKRRKIQIVRGYTGTNFVLQNQRYNSIYGYAAPWLTFYIARSGESNRNNGIVDNPDPNVRVNFTQWTE